MENKYRVLGCYMKKKFPDCRVDSFDIYPEFVDNSRKVAKENGLKLNVQRSDMFASSNKKYDLITFNPPYVPLGYDTHDVNYDKIRFSGSEGVDLMNQFLAEVDEFLNPTGIIYLGINCFYVSEDKCIKTIEEFGFTIEHISRINMNTSRVFIIKKIKK